jgi:hypothetical protein
MDSNWSEVENNIISEENVFGCLDVNTPTITIMESTIGNLTVFCGSCFKSDGSFLSVDLRAVVNLDVLHNC